MTWLPEQLLPSGAAGLVPWVSVVDYGAAGDGTTDDTAAIQAAIDALPATGGGIYAPAGTYRLTGALNLVSDLIITGAGVDSTVFRQDDTAANALTGVDVNTLTLRDLQLQGPGSGTGKGLELTRSVEPNVRYVRLDGVYVRLFGSHGVDISNCIVSSWDQVVSENNGGEGIYLHGVVGGAAGTSVAMNAVFANTNTGTGIHLLNMAYVSLVGCASEGQPTNYLLEDCQGVSLVGCGSEVMTAAGTGIKVDGGVGITLVSCWDLNNRGVAFHVTGSATNVNLIGLVENSPLGGATASLKVDAGCVGINLHGITNVTGMSLAAATTNILNDGANGLVLHGYLYTDAASEFNGNVIFDQAATVYGAFAHAGASLGFYGTAAAAKPTVTGSRGGNAALASLLTALAGLGLVTDSSTA